MAWIWPWRGLAMLHKTGEDHREMRGSLGRGAPGTKLIFNTNISVYLGCCAASCAWFHLHFWNSLSNPQVAWWDGFPASLTWEPEKLLSKWDAPYSIRLGQLLVIPYQGYCGAIWMNSIRCSNMKMLISDMFSARVQWILSCMVFYR